MVHHLANVWQEGAYQVIRPAFYDELTEPEEAQWIRWLQKWLQMIKDDPLGLEEQVTSC